MHGLGKGKEEEGTEGTSSFAREDAYGNISVDHVRPLYTPAVS